MRSRDGSSTFSLSISSLVLFTSLTLNADEYLISYRYVVKDATLYNETLHVSKAMSKCAGSPQKHLVLESYDHNNLVDIISTNYEEFINYIHKLGLDINHNDLTISMQNKSTTILTLKTTCFKVDFNDNSVKITHLK